MKKTAGYTRTALVFELLVAAFGVLLVLNVNIGSKNVSIPPGRIFKGCAPKTLPHFPTRGHP